MDITVRMYRVGFGDCYLLTFHGAKPQYVLVDCGVHRSGDIKVMPQVVRSIAQVTGRKLALMVITHAHRDHVSAFDEFAEEWANFTIGEIWMPWTEDPDSKVAARWRKRKFALIQSLRGAPAFGGAGELGAAAQAAAENMDATKSAMRNLAGGLGTAAQVIYCLPRTRIQKAAGVPGLVVDVLGPPRTRSFSRA